MNNTFAESIACLFEGVDPTLMPFLKGAAFVHDDDSVETYGAIQKMAAHFAANLYAAAGERLSFEYSLFDSLRKVAKWEEGYDRFTTPVLDVLTRVVADARLQECELEHVNKQAAVPGFLLNLLGTTAAAAPTVSKMLLGMGAATGAAAGGLTWGLNRHSSEDENKIEAMKERVNHYKRITREISEDLKRNAVMNDPRDSRRLIAEDAATSFVN